MLAVLSSLFRWVCVTIGATDAQSGQTFEYTRFAFNPVLDEFTTIDLSNSWSSEYYPEDQLMSKLAGTASLNTELWMHLESEGTYSYQKIFRKGAQTFPLAVAVISVTNGAVDGITWDTGCFDCDDSSCTRNTYRFSGEPYDNAGKECYK